MRTVLVPLDGSSTAVLGPLRRFLLGARADQGGHRPAARFGAGLVLLHVAAPPGASLEEELELAHSRAELDALRLELERDGISATVRVARGEAVERILAAASEVRADLVAMTSHGRSGLARLVYGSVAEAVLRQGTTPVLLVTEQAASGLTDGLRSLLVPLDGTTDALQILPLVRTIAAPTDAEVVLLHVEETPGSSAEVFAAARAKLGVARVREVVTTGGPGAAILAAAEREAVDLVVLSTHGRDGLDRLWNGSVAEEVARVSPVPVIVRRVAT